MLQGWNKFCMIGGIVEFSAKLPGKSSVGGLWPAREYIQSSVLTTIHEFGNNSRIFINNENVFAQSSQYGY